jgi:rubrerythrin
VDQPINPDEGKWTPEELERVQPLLSLTGVDYTRMVVDSQAMVVPMMKDPVNSGLGTFHELLYQVQAYRDTLTNYISSVVADKATWESYESNLKHISKERKRRYMQQDEIKKLRNAEMQTNACEMMMPHVMQLCQYVEEVLSYINNVLKILQQRQENLDSAKENISRQITVIQHQITIGELHRVQ